MKNALHCPATITWREKLKADLTFRFPFSYWEDESQWLTGGKTLKNVKNLFGVEANMHRNAAWSLKVLKCCRPVTLTTNCFKCTWICFHFVVFPVRSDLFFPKKVFYFWNISPNSGSERRNEKFLVGVSMTVLMVFQKWILSLHVLFS